MYLRKYWLLLEFASATPGMVLLRWLTGCVFAFIFKCFSSQGEKEDRKSGTT